jgi:hypothetical protein
MKIIHGYCVMEWIRTILLSHHITITVKLASCFKSKIRGKKKCVSSEVNILQSAATGQEDSGQVKEHYIEQVTVAVLVTRSRSGRASAAEIKGGRAL